MEEYEKNEDIRIYHFVEELVLSYTDYITPFIEKYNLTLNELPLLLRLRFKKEMTQTDLAKEFHLSNGYTSKIFKKFEELNLIERVENTENRRKKIIKFKKDGIELTDEIIDLLDKWEDNRLSSLTKVEEKQLKSILYKLLIIKGEN